MDVVVGEGFVLGDGTRLVSLEAWSGSVVVVGGWFWS